MLVKQYSIVCVGCFFVFFCYACTATTKPNKPLPGPYTDSMDKLFTKNDLLVHELCKLPEIQDGVSESEKEALEQILELYDNHQEKFNSMFRKMYATGRPEVRKYCTPLQAFFWLLEENRFYDFESLLNDYDTNNLLNLAWKFEIKNLISQTQIEVVIDETRNMKIKNEYQNTYREFGPKKVEKHILFDFQRKPSWFSRKARDILENAVQTGSKRWNDFETTTDRLNSPEIISFYEKRQIDYTYWHTIPGYSNNALLSSYASYVFKHKKGDCVYISGFTVYCLRKAGYDANLWRWPTPGGRFRSHMVAVYYDNGKKMILDNGKPNPFKVGIIPFDVYKNN